MRETPIHEIYRKAPGLLGLREMDKLEGRCGACEYRWVCGGSRARAFAATGNPMASDPLCVYEPEAQAAE